MVQAAETFIDPTPHTDGEPAASRLVGSIWKKLAEGPAQGLRLFPCAGVLGVMEGMEP